MAMLAGQRSTHQAVRLDWESTQTAFESPQNTHIHTMTTFPRAVSDVTACLTHRSVRATAPVEQGRQRRFHQITLALLLRVSSTRPPSPSVFEGGCCKKQTILWIGVLIRQRGRQHVSKHRTNTVAVPRFSAISIFCYLSKHFPLTHGTVIYNVYTRIIQA